MLPHHIQKLELGHCGSADSSSPTTKPPTAFFPRRDRWGGTWLQILSGPYLRSVVCSFELSNGEDRPSPAQAGAWIQRAALSQADTLSLTQAVPFLHLGNCACLSVFSWALRNPWSQHRRTPGVLRPTPCLYSVPTLPLLSNATLPGLLRKASHLHLVPVGSGREGLPLSCPPPPRASG